MCIQGVLRIHVVEAKELEKADISLMGKGKSDPYTVIRSKSYMYRFNRSHVLCMLF